MSQVSLYLDQPTMEKLRADAMHENLSLSQFAANLIRNYSAESQWPQDYWDLYGCLSDEELCAPQDSVPTEETRLFDDFAIR